MRGFLIWNQLFECVKITIVVINGCSLECKDNPSDIFWICFPIFPFLSDFGLYMYTWLCYIDLGISWY